MNNGEWIRANKNEPCKICEKTDWCCITSDGRLANCMRIESDKPCKNGGWIHKLTDEKKVFTPRPQSKPKPAEPKKDFFGLTQEYIQKIESLHPARCLLAKQLGLNEDSLKRLQVGFDGKDYTFPMRNGRNKIIGIRTRTPDGKKFCIPGSQTGLFIPAGVKQDSKNLLFICEGPTDCAALLDLGFDAIGRPSCSGGTEHIKTVLTGYDRQVVIMADKDSPKIAANGRSFCPGQEGAERLAKEIKTIVHSVRVIKPRFGKDVREWYTKHGATATEIMLVLKQAKFV